MEKELSSINIPHEAYILSSTWLSSGIGLELSMLGCSKIPEKNELSRETLMYNDHVTCVSTQSIWLTPSYYYLVLNNQLRVFWKPLGKHAI